MHCRFISDINLIDAEAWNRLVEENHPFLKHQFLSALEQHDCVGKTVGWEPCHAVVEDNDGTLIGAMPLYIKYHSHGEFVFDWSWAEAYQQHGLSYYPKLISAIPFTPLTGARLLTSAQHSPQSTRRLMLDACIEMATERGLSSIHWLFPDHEDKAFLESASLHLRLGCQYHWHNQRYSDFEDFLSRLSSRKRKNILIERKQVRSAGIHFKTLHGDEISPAQWRLFHQYYCAIYDRKWGFPSLSLPFFEALGRTMADQIVMVCAYQGDDCIATALNFKSDTTLYGRHWGCRDQIAGLHFESCYYQGLEYCIERGLTHFEPGAQGEHKIARGFLPTRTWSAHWIAHPAFNRAVGDFVEREAVAMEKMIEQLSQHSPYREA